jgi:hypothetical protein
MKALRTLVVEDDAILGELLAKTLEVSAMRSAPWRPMSPKRWPPLPIGARI